jgi:hypothetical protein
MALFRAAALFLWFFQSTGIVPLAWQWSQGTGTQAVSFNIYYGTISGIYPNIVNTGGFTLTFIVNGLTLGQNYCFAATALDASRNESGFSNEICGTPTSQTFGPPLNFQITGTSPD